MLKSTAAVSSGTYPAVSSEQLRAAMGHFATGVAVITACDAAGRGYGSTANAISSLSLQPPLVLACLRRESATLAAARSTGRWAINVLRGDQQPVAERFAHRASVAWSGVSHRLADGVPVLDDALASVECRTHQLVDGGDHVIMIGWVTAVTHPDRQEHPLVFFRGDYVGVTPHARALPGPPEDALVVSLPSRLGDLRLLPLPSADAGATVAALVGEPAGTRGAVLVTHRGCLLGDALGSERCQSGARLDRVLATLQASSRPGVILYHREPGLGICSVCLGADDDAPSASEFEREAIARVLDMLGMADPIIVVGEADEMALADGRL